MWMRKFKEGFRGKRRGNRRKRLLYKMRYLKSQSEFHQTPLSQTTKSGQFPPPRTEKSRTENSSPSEFARKGPKFCPRLRS